MLHTPPWSLHRQAEVPGPHFVEISSSSTMRSVPPFSEADVADFFGRAVTPHRDESDSESVRSTPSEDRMNSMESSLAKCLETIARQNEQLVTQAATLERLFKAQADPEEIQTSTYKVADSILQKLGRNSAGKMSWLEHKAIAKIRKTPDPQGTRGYVHHVAFPRTLTC